MRKMILAAALLALPLAGAQAQAIPTNCSGVVEAVGWQSQSERGYWASSVDLRNVSGRAVQVTVQYNGAGAFNQPAFRMEPGAWIRRWLARTSSGVPEATLRASTTLICAEPR
ncbi:hypothetical protein KTR66_03200 [Roseococcus sp. SDR]|uniref:hypothetical protein n=1 Tax=Roseococcus sp. SDR TaxID=2835532 RepID=UPI001BCD7582|nr:hypothetical protein [Roseococcus sp. SDR]MBS7788984.1 hypothetical protein [Roseococcus sp. SDR]MBV1844298.1 hypothetical protein [Roseococcus sp. SDR]